MAAQTAEDPDTHASTLAAQRRALPDQPGVYLFRDERGRVIYVGKAVSIRKRVASHFAKTQLASTPGHAEMVASVAHVECVVVASESEALLTEQGFIKQYRPRFNIRLRDDKSYPFIAISLDEDYPRVYFTRERHRPGRAYYGPYSNAKRVRATLEVLAKVFMFRSCTGPEPGRRSGSPCLDYYIKRCTAPCVDYISREDYRASIEQVGDFLSGRFVAIERDLETRMRAAAAAEEFEQATLERNRLRAVHSLLERRRVANASAGTFDAVAVAIDGREANAQVFQIRDGVLTDRQSFYLSNETERGVADVAEEFMLQYYAGHLSIPALIVVQRELASDDEVGPLAEALASRRDGPVEIRPAERGEKRRILDLAHRNALLALDQERLRAERRRQTRVDALEGLQQALGLDVPPIRIECFDISHLGGDSDRRLDGRVRGRRPAQVRLPPLSHPLASGGRLRRLRRDGRGAGASLRPVGGPGRHLPARLRLRLELRLAAQPRRDRRRRRPTRRRPAAAARVSRARRRGRLAGQAHRGGVHARPPHAARARPLHARAAAAPARARRGPSLRRHPPSHPPRSRDDRLAAGRLARDRPRAQAALLAHFGSPEAVAAASSEELQAVPGLPAKVARELHSSLHRAG